jgi:hypothetical protein
MCVNDLVHWEVTQSNVVQNQIIDKLFTWLVLIVVRDMLKGFIDGHEKGAVCLGAIEQLH